MMSESDKGASQKNNSSPTGGASTPTNANSNSIPGENEHLNSNYEGLTEEEIEQRKQLEEQWKQELAKTEEEIETLRRVLQSKIRTANELKRKIGVTVWDEFRRDISTGLKTVQESDAYKVASEQMDSISHNQLYQKATATVGTAANKTTGIVNTVGDEMAKNLRMLKNSTAFKSFEDKASEIYNFTRSKVTGTAPTSAATTPASSTTDPTTGFPSGSKDESGDSAPTIDTKHNAGSSKA